MHPEQPVLGGDKGLRHDRRNLVVRHVDPPLVAEVGDQLVVRRIDPAFERRFVGLQRLNARQPGAEHDEADGAGGEHRDDEQEPYAIGAADQ